MVIIIDELFTVIGTLLIVVLILFLSYYFTKKFGGALGGYSRSSNLKIVDRLNINQTDSLFIIELGESYYLIGATPSGINLLKELKREDLNLMDKDSNDIGTSLNFAELLSKKINNKK